MKCSECGASDQIIEPFGPESRGCLSCFKITLRKELNSKEFSDVIYSRNPFLNLIVKIEENDEGMGLPLEYKKVGE